MAESFINRREFLQSAAWGVGGFFLFPPDSIEKKSLLPSDPKRMVRALGKTNIRLPLVSMGMFSTAEPILARTALDSGIYYIDTAHDDQQGKSEEIAGEAIKGRSRSSYFISTKVKLPRDPITGLYPPEATGDEFLRKLEISLKRLGLAWVDLLYHHDVSRKESALQDPILKAMEWAKTNGLARFVGISTHRNEPEVIQAAIDSKFYEVVLTSYNFRQQHYIEMREAIAAAAQAGLGIVAMKVMGGVLPSEGRPNHARAALKWVLQDPNVHTAVLGISTFEELNVDLAVMEDINLDDSEREYLVMAASRPGFYCQGCRKCLSHCPQKLPIPDLMRAYMYVYGYRKPALARDLIQALNLPSRICEDCSSCPIRCSSGFNIAGKIRDVVRLRSVPSEFIT